MKIIEFLKTYKNKLMQSIDRKRDYYSPLCLTNGSMYFKCISEDKLLIINIEGDLTISTCKDSHVVLREFKEGKLDKISLTEFDNILRESTYKILDYANY